jgi:hypothetical protein
MRVLERLNRLDDRVLGPPGRFTLAPALLTLFALDIAGSFFGGTDSVRVPWHTRERVVLVAVVGMLCGALWQVRKRRDLAERLAPAAVLAPLLVVSVALRVRWEVDPVDAAGVAGVLTGLIQGELYCRRRDRRKVVERSR